MDRKTGLRLFAISMVVILGSSALAATYPEHGELASYGILIYVALLLAWAIFRKKTNSGQNIPS